MKYTEEFVGIKTKHIHEFNSLHDFNNYIMNTPINNIFKNESLASISGNKKFTGTDSFNEAMDLFKNGWSTMAEEIELKLKATKNQIQPKTTRRSYFDVTGFQASVPRYLQGIPTNMVNQKSVVQKQKVITFNKDISYSAFTSKEEIIDSSIKALQIIKQVEAQGIRCNLNLIWGVYAHTEMNVMKIKLKSANERMNISKLAFPLVHPSMLRRLLFRYEEVCPTFTKREFTIGYGFPVSSKDLQIENEYLLPKIIEDIESIINNLK